MSADRTKFWGRYVAFLTRHHIWVLLIGLIMAGLGGWSASRFQLKTNFAALLPQDEPSIKDLERAKARKGGLSNLTIAVEGDDPEANRRLVDALAQRFAKLPKDKIVYIRYHLNAEREFYSNNKHLYANLEDLDTIYRRLKAKIRYERIKNNPLLIKLDGEELEPVEFDLSDIKAKYESKTKRFDRYRDGYLNTEEGRLWAIKVYPPGFATGVKNGKKLLRTMREASAEVCTGATVPAGLDQQQLDDLIQRSCKAKYGPSIKVGFCGGIVTAIVEQKAIIDDLLLVTSICLSLVLLVVLIYFRSFRALPIVGLPLVMGTAITFGISIYIVEHLNTATAFLAAIVVGNGINFGLIQLARYTEERRAGKPLEQALVDALRYTVKATSVAAMAASIAYGSLIITEFRGFNGFGYMGGLGMLICWVSAFTLQPALLLFLERIRKARFKPRISARAERPGGVLFRPYARFVARYGISVHGLGWALVAVSMFFILPYLQDPYEYNFRNLRNQREGRAAYKLNGRVGKMFTKRQNPMFILADRPSQVPLIINELERNNSMGPNKLLFKQIRSLYGFLPADQKAKIKVLKKIRRQLSKSTLSWLSDEDRAQIDKYVPPKGIKPLDIDDLPLSMTRMFTEKDGSMGLPIALYPRDGRTVWDGRFLIELSDASRTIRLPDGDVVTSAGSATIFADMIQAIERDGPRAVIASLLGVLLLVILAYRTLEYILVTLVVLFFGVMWTIGPVAMMDLKLNFLNFIGLPITFGIGIDYAVNVLNRYRIEGPGSVEKVIATTGGAVALCSLTTLIGYSSLLIARNNALVSFGILADIGELASLFAAILLLPAILLMIERYRKRKTAFRARDKAAATTENP